MKLILYIFTALVLLKMIDLVISQRLINRYKMYGIFGKPGSGKSTFLTKVAYQHVKKGWEVYTDDPTCKVDGVNYFNSLDFKSGHWIPDGRKGQPWVDGTINEKNRDILLIFDEIGSLYNNREFKTNLTPETVRWWAEHRHKRVKIYYGSQSYKDMDLKIRQKSDQLMIVKRSKLLSSFSIAKPILIDIDIQNNENTDNAGGTIVDKYQYDLIFFWKFINLAKWTKKFNSYR